MTDGPREILKAAGVECREVEVFLDLRRRPTEFGYTQSDKDAGIAAVLALARLVAKYKWQRDRLKELLVYLPDLDALWEARDD